MRIEYCAKCGLRVDEEEMRGGAKRLGEAIVCPICVRTGKYPELVNAPPASGEIQQAPTTSGQHRAFTQRSVRPRSTEVQPTIQPKKQSLALWIGGGAVVGGLLALILFSGKKPEPPPVAKNDPVEARTEVPKKEIKPPVDTKPPVEAKKKEDDYDPQAVMAASLLDQAKAFYRANSDEPYLARQKFDDVIQRFAGKPSAEHALTFAKEYKLPDLAALDALPTNADWEKAVHLVSRVNPAQDLLIGKWETRGALLVSSDERRGNTAQLVLPYEPPPEFDLRILFSRTNGKDALGITFPYAPHGATFMAGGWGNRVFGFETVRSARADAISANLNQQDFLENSRGYELVLRVRNGVARAYINGRKVAEMLAPRGEIMPYYTHFGSPFTKRLLLSSYETVFEIKALDVIEIGGRGKVIELNDRRKELQPGLWVDRYKAKDRGSRFGEFLFGLPVSQPNFEEGGSPGHRFAHNDDFDLRYKGQLRIEKAGTYRFQIQADNEVSLYIDGNKLGSHTWPNPSHVIQIELTAGNHPFRVDFSEHDGGEMLNVLWQPPGTANFERIPPVVLWFNPEHDALTR